MGGGFKYLFLCPGARIMYIPPSHKVQTQKKEGGELSIRDSFGTKREPLHFHLIYTQKETGNHGLVTILKYLSMVFFNESITVFCWSRKEKVKKCYYLVAICYSLYSLYLVAVCYSLNCNQRLVVKSSVSPMGTFPGAPFCSLGYLTCTWRFWGKTILRFGDSCPDSAEDAQVFFPCGFWWQILLEPPGVFNFKETRSGGNKMKTEGGITILGTVLLDSRDMPILGESPWRNRFGVRGFP